MSKTRKPVRIGEKFTRLLVISEAPAKISSKGIKIYSVLVKCDCGNQIIVAEYKLRDGHSKSCGCIGRGPKGNPLHKQFPKEYEAWCGMKDRCSPNINSRSYKHYFGRGIIVCERWFNNFENFLNDMPIHPGKGYTLERINNNKIYEPDNCKWATRYTQTRNQRNNKNVIINGIQMCQTDATKILNVEASKISRLVRQLNISHQKVVDLLLLNPRPDNIKKFREILTREKQ